MPMQFNINGSIFQADGPFNSTDMLQRAAGVYVILGRNSTSDLWNVLDVGESENVQERVSRHDRANQWQRCGYPQLAVAPIYNINKGWEGRLWVEQQLRAMYRPPCGDR